MNSFLPIPVSKLATLAARTNCRTSPLAILALKIRKVDVNAKTSTDCFVRAENLRVGRG